MDLSRCHAIGTRILSIMTLAKITFTNARKWALAHNKSRDPDSIPTDLAEYYDHDDRETNRMLHNSGPERRHMADHQEDISGRKDKEDDATDTRKATRTTKAKM